MKNEIARIIFVGLVLISFFVTSVGAIAEPTVDSITIDPSDPAPLSNINFTAEISGDNVSGVYLIVKECRDDFCYTPGLNESMNETASGQYEKEIKLTHFDANNIEYWLVINSNGTWYNFQESYVQKDLKAASGNGSSSSKQTPGFELSLFIVAIALLLFIAKQKRSK